MTVNMAENCVIWTERCQVLQGSGKPGKVTKDLETEMAGDGCGLHIPHQGSLGFMRERWQSINHSKSVLINRLFKKQKHVENSFSLCSLNRCLLKGFGMANRNLFIWNLLEVQMWLEKSHTWQQVKEMQRDNKIWNGPSFS